MSERGGAPSVFSIPSGLPFLPTLADAMLDGRLMPARPDEPLAMADVTVLLPTRRAARSLREILLERMGGAAAIMPRIRPIGDVDEEDHLLDPQQGGEDGADGPAAAPALLPAAVLELDRRLALTRLTLAWAAGVQRDILPHAAGDDLAIPASAADAARLARYLARLIDDMETAGCAWEAIDRLPPAELTGFFQVTLSFLQIVSHIWPAHLLEIGRVDPAVRRDTLIRAEARRLAAGGAGPVIAAGSTGSIPATAELLRAIAHAPAGVVVLPGLDRDLDARGWHAVGDEETGGAAAHAHPQFGLKRLIEAIGIERHDVMALGEATASGTARAALMSEVMRPSETSEAWSVRLAAGVTTAALHDVALVIARNEQEEALAVAVTMRQALEEGEVTAALVTPDRHLARRVAAELTRWGLAVDDSAGTGLDRDPAGIFCRLVAAVADPDIDAVTLLAFLRHPLTGLGLPAGERAAAIAALEVAALRGMRFIGGVAGLSERLATLRHGAERRSRQGMPAAARRLSSRSWDIAIGLAETLRNACAPLTALYAPGAENVTVAHAAAHLMGVMQAIGDEEAMATAPGAAALNTLLDALTTSEHGAALTLPARDLPGFLNALMGEVNLPRPPGADPRLHIWGTLEARLQAVDVLILGGLDEGVWPAATRTDPWLSRAMRAELGLSPPERRLGLAAHDFVQGFANSRVVCTRAHKRGGAPSVEARWLQRLRAVVGEDALAPALARGDALLAVSRQVHQPDGLGGPVSQPAPRPPLAARPKTLRITEVETLIRDPYAVYARRILCLEPLEPIGVGRDRALRGTLFHEALGQFTQDWAAPYDAAALDHLRAIAVKVLTEIADTPELHAIWSARFDEIARWLVAWEHERDPDVERRLAEIDGTLDVGGVRLKGRADRIDVMADESLAIYDYKTTSPPTARQVFAGLAPQMTLEAAMARNGAFDESFAGRTVSTLAWLALGHVGRSDVVTTAVGRGQTADELADRALQLFTELVAAYDDPQRGYLSRARPLTARGRFRGDYDHLARVQEWSLLESEDDYR
ncbi:MAG: double-strand break repair protein AddB [Alphaproteobacteria bacterium]